MPLYVQGFSTYAGFHTGTVASVVTNAEAQLAGGYRPTVPQDFPEGTQINRNANQVRILNELEDQYNKTQDSRDVAGQTLSSLRDTKGNNKEKTLKEIKTYRDTLTAENDKLLKNGSAKVQRQKNDKENASIADQITKSRGNPNGANQVSQKEIDAFKAAASKPASVKAQVLKKKNKKKPAKPKGRKK